MSERDKCASRQHCARLTAAQRARQCSCTVRERGGSTPAKPFKVGRDDARFMKSLRIKVEDEDRV